MRPYNRRMPHDLAPTLEAAIQHEAPLLRGITDEQAALRPASGKWSKKEELGHLIDSATNNHVRFVAASLQREYRGPGYEQQGWVDRHGYQDMAWADLVDFWEKYNRLLAAVVGRIPEDRLPTPCAIGNGPLVSLRFIIEDYVLHMQHHLDHILQREKLTQYPGAAVGV